MESPAKAGSLKSQMKAMQALCDDQQVQLEEANAQLEHLTGEKERLEDSLKEKESALNARISREIIDLKEEMEHKFSLQVAENKRLQHHITLQKKEAEKMSAALLALQERMQAVELEVIE